MVAFGVETFVYSREPALDERGRLAVSFGATCVSAQDTPVGELRDRIGLVNMIFEAVGVARVAFGALHALAPNGECVLTGIPAKAPPSRSRSMR